MDNYLSSKAILSLKGLPSINLKRKGNHDMSPFRLKPTHYDDDRVETPHFAISHMKTLSAGLGVESSYMKTPISKYSRRNIQTIKSSSSDKAHRFKALNATERMSKRPDVRENSALKGLYTKLLSEQRRLQDRVKHQQNRIDQLTNYHESMSTLKSSQKASFKQSFPRHIFTTRKNNKY